ncbi:MAG TPA: efflux RND transporter permease subunit [Polyangiaceae bacterium LLY-WYZ-14_1]|nr:efflux RND transporter permease subunit [Polyangiaceae bacterium LLY-WYZ-14_1]
MSGADRSDDVGVSGRIARAFIDAKLTPLIIVTTVLLGVGATAMLPREEEPQIKVPMVDVMVRMPGSTAKEVEERATRPMEQLLWEVPGVEYVYSMSRPGESLVIVRFEVGSEAEDALVRLNHKLQSNYDRIPHGVSSPLIKLRSIDDVPVLALTFHSDRYDHLTLRRLAAQVEDEVKQVDDVAETRLIGGFQRTVRVLLDPGKLAGRNLSLAGIVPVLQQNNRQFRAGGLTTANREVMIDTGAFLRSAEDVGDIVVGANAGRPVYLREVAEIVDGAPEPSQYVFHGEGAARSPNAGERPAVTLTVAKRPGTNAVTVTDTVIAKVDTLKGWIIPGDVGVAVTRHYGETASEKSNELLFHMGIAVVSVSILILLTLGWRESGIVALAIPSTLALALVVFYLAGFTLNRITLFALIFSIGILVDDAIVVVENIVRHVRLPENRGRSRLRVAVEAVDEVGNPTILATFTVIFAVLPMAFVGGLMGPYMRPIPIGASAAMLFSLLIAFIVTPWAAVRMLRRERGGDEGGGASPGGAGREKDAPAPARTTAGAGSHENHGDDGHGHPEDLFTKAYRRMMGPLILSVPARWAFLGLITALLGGAMALVGVGFVKVKMLPFDNKSEFQVILNTPEGSSLEHTARVAREVAQAIREEPEVLDYQVYVGTAAPTNFNGLVRHYFAREGAHVADLQINLTPKHHRSAQSHEIAKRVRPRVAEIVERYGARVAIAEVPPGPPVLQTLVAEVYAPTPEARRALAGEVREIFKSTEGVVDVDWYFEDDQERARFAIDKEKAALHGVSPATISHTLEMAVTGTSVDLVHVPREREDVNLVLEVPRDKRSIPEDLLGIRVRSGDANALPEPVPGEAPPLVPLRELVRIERQPDEKTIHHKNLKPVIYVVGDVAGEVESPAYAIFEMNERLAALDPAAFGGASTEVAITNLEQPFTDREPAIKWDGEWHVTLEVFRDLGIAFAVVLMLIYILMVGWFRSFVTPVVVMAAIPFSLVGILPAHGAMGAFFTATSMIGFMAGAGIVVRNSIILVDFIELRLREGMPMAEAVVDAGAVRFRPMLLTAMAVVVGAGVILADPIFQGLAISLIFGEIASLLVSRMAVPVLYYMVYQRRLPESVRKDAGASSSYSSSARPV